MPVTPCTHSIIITSITYCMTFKTENNTGGSGGLSRETFRNTLAQ